MACTFFIIFKAGGRSWAFLYFATIPFLNWSFGVIKPIELAAVSEFFSHGASLHPLTLVTGLVFVFRDFVQRTMGQKVLIVMALAIAWSFYYALPAIALASGAAFAIAEGADWALYTFSRYRLSTRIVLSSALAVPIDSTIFLFGAEMALRGTDGFTAGDMLNPVNWIIFVIGKMVGAFIVSYFVRRREDRGLIDPEAV
ncbi:MAG: hypothetical protein V3V03_02020 [Hyphomonadaceae bacterium]